MDGTPWVLDRPVPLADIRRIFTEQPETETDFYRRVTSRLLESDTP